MRIKLLLIALISLYLTEGFAQEKELVFSLQEAQSYALQHNKTLMNANQDIQMAREKFREAIGAGFPQVSGSFDYMTNFNYEAEVEFGGGGSTEPPDINYSLLDAGDYEVMSFIAQSFGSSGPMVIVMEDQASANVQVSQLIFNGQLFVGIEMAKIGRKIAETSYAMTELDVKETVVQSYYLVLVTQDLLRIIVENKNNLEEVMQHTDNMYKVGMAEQTDVDQIRVSLSQLENSQKAMERNLLLNKNMLRFVMGVEGEGELELTDDLNSIVSKLEESGLVIDEFDITVNPTYQIMEEQELLMKKSVALNRWSYFPTVAAYYAYREKILTTAFDLSPKHAAGLTVSVPIFSGGTKKAQVSQSKIELDKASRNKDLVEEQLTLQMRQLNFDFSSAWENYLTQKENVEVAMRVYENINNKYKQGMMSSLDLTQANTNYLMAQNNYISSVLSLLQSKMRLDKLYNTL